MPKKLDPTNPKCPFCQSKATVKNGQRIIKLRAYQRFRCTSCQKYFSSQPLLQKHRTYPINLILNTLSNLNLGYSIKQTQSYFKGKSHNQKTKIPKSTIGCWYNQLKPFLPYHRIRTKIKTQYTPIN